jgi:hypothetical protein
MEGSRRVSAVRRFAVFAVPMLVLSSIVGPGCGCGDDDDLGGTTPQTTACTIEVSWTRGEATCELVDVFLLFDDTGSFAGTAPVVQGIFADLVTNLQTAFPSIDFAFGVGRFEDFGGPGNDFSGENSTGRPFTLNQPILATSDPLFAASLATALTATAPGFGGDGPETDIEALFQVATGAGFDGNGNATLLDSGPAGAPGTQVTPGDSGDVPPFSSNVAPTSGTLGGAGFRAGSCRLVIMATDICTVAPFPGSIPVNVTGTGGSVPVEQFACSSIEAGVDRFGFISDSKTAAANTVAGAVAPLGAAGVQQTINALNALGIRVIGLTNQVAGPSDVPVAPVTGPDFDGISMLQAVATLTGAVDNLGNPLVFPINTGDSSGLQAAITAAIGTAITTDIDVELVPLTVAPCLGVPLISPAVVPAIGAGETATFTVTLDVCTAADAIFEFRDVASASVVATAGITFEDPCVPLLTERTIGDVSVTTD